MGALSRWPAVCARSSAMLEHVLPGLFHAPNIHPLLVHFPLALWPTALVFLALGYLRGSDELYRVGRWLLLAGTAGGVAAAITGWLAADGLGHDHPGHDVIHDHRTLMLAALVSALAGCAAALWTRPEARRKHRWAPVGITLVTCLFAALGADRGALAVFGHGIGIKAERPAIAASDPGDAHGPPSRGPSHDHHDH